MHKTGIEDYYIIKDNKKMRFGYTTGSCAAAAAKGAAYMLLTGRRVETVDLLTPKGIRLNLELEDIRLGTDKVSCAVRKDGGDDPDATNGILIYASVSRLRPSIQEEIPPHASYQNGILIDGGTGVGRVTKEGMKQKVGEAAINPVPMQMIRQNVQAIREELEYQGSLKVIISIPQGEEIAKKTFNPRLGIVGGISVLGTTGIVEPMSEASLIASISLEMQMKVKEGREYLLISPGNYGEDFIHNDMHLDMSAALQCSNYLGETLDMAVNMGVKGILLVSHVGKLIKVAGGIMNTHSHNADCRAELMAAFALRAGADADTARRILNTITTDEALDIMEEKGIRSKAMDLAAERAKYYMQFRTYKRILTEAVFFTPKYGILSRTDGANEMIRRFLPEKPEEF